MENTAMKSYFRLRFKNSFLVQYILPLTNINAKMMQCGYNIFITNQGPQKFFECVNKIADYEAQKIKLKSIEERIFNVSTTNIENFHYQYLITLIFMRPQIRKSFILASYLGKPIIFPLKSEWIEIFENNGFQFSKKVSKNLWKILLFLLAMNQLKKYTFSIASYKIVRNKNKNRWFSNDCKNVYFYDFPAESLKLATMDFKYKNALAWIKNFMPGNHNLVAFSKHGDQFEKSSHVRLDKVYGPLILKKEIGIFLNLIVNVFFNLKHKNKISLLMVNLYAIIEYNRIRCYQSQIFIDEIYVSCSSGATKPLWFYATEKLGIDNYLYFYAAFTEPRFNLDQVQIFGAWHLSTWENYVLPDQFFKKELQSIIPKSNQKFFLYGMPWWLDYEQEIRSNYKQKIVIFDKATSKPISQFSVIAINGGEDLEYSEKYICDILQAISSLDCQIFYKLKRTINNNHDNINIRIESMKLKNFTTVNEKVAPIRLIEQADLVISRAASSTALIAKEAGKNSIIYDPCSIINGADPSYRGIEVIQGLENLKNYVKTL
jgi:polysaccharide biosynthesis PFTS motif protein